MTMKRILAATTALAVVCLAPAARAAGGTIVDDFVSGATTISACGNSEFRYHEDPSILGGAREARARDGHSCVLGGRSHLDIVVSDGGYADFYGKTANEGTIHYGSVIGTIGEPWSPSPNGGKGVELNIAAGADDQFQFDLLEIYDSWPYLQVQLYSGSFPGYRFIQNVGSLVVGENLAPISAPPAGSPHVGGFSDQWGSPIPAAALADIDGILISASHASGNTPGSGNRIDRISIVSGTIQVTIDVKPGSDRNPINLKGNGVIPVAILTTEDFDATTVDPATVRFGPGEAEEAHGKGHIEDVDNDGRDDLVLHFKTGEAGILDGDTEAGLTGQTFDDQDIEGSDVIDTSVGKGKGAGKVVTSGQQEASWGEIKNGFR